MCAFRGTIFYSGEFVTLMNSDMDGSETFSSTLGVQSAEKTQAPEPIPNRLGRFVVLRKIGQGGMGVVYAAYDEELDRKVALKMLHVSNPTDKERRIRTLREAQAMARVAHPNVVSIYEVGEIDTQIFLAMELVEGTTLRHWQREAGRAWEEVLNVYLDAGNGLLAAHQAGLVHRDFKPENISSVEKLRNFVRIPRLGMRTN